MTEFRFLGKMSYNLQFCELSGSYWSLFQEFQIVCPVCHQKVVPYIIAVKHWHFAVTTALQHQSSILKKKKKPLHRLHYIYSRLKQDS